MNVNVQKVPEGHHFVPQCYLNEFAINKNLFCLDLSLISRGLRFQVRKTTPKQACKRNFLYKIEKQDFQFIDDKKIENLFYLEVLGFKKKEDNYRKIKCKLLKDRKVSNSDATTFINFIIDLKARNPRFLENIQKLIDDYSEESFNILLKEINTDFSNINDNLKKSFIESIAINLKDKFLNNPDFARQFGVAFLVNTSDEEFLKRKMLLNKLLKLRWFIYEIKSEEEFITNDNPGFSLDSNFQFYNTRFEEDFQFHLPLDSKNCLVMNGDVSDRLYTITETSKEIEFKIADAAFVNQVNVGQIIEPIQFLYSRSKSTLESFIPTVISYQELNKLNAF